MEIRMCRRAATLILTLAFFSQTGALAQRNVREPQTKREPTSQDLGYQGNYHLVKSPNLTPIEKIMRKADFCQIDGYGYHMIIPNCASELDEDGEMPTDEVSTDKIRYLLEGDVLKYYELEEEYNTPLKLKRFKESENYRYLKSCMESDRGCFLDHTYYAIFDVSSQYDLNSCSFAIPLATSFRSYTYIAKNVAISTNDKHFKYSDFVTPKIGEDLAYQIETNATEIVVFVKFTGKTDDDDLICKPLKVYITDKKTGQIYFEYTSSNTVNNDDLILQDSKDEAEEETIVEVTETMPEFPGGDKALLKFLSDNMIYPKKAQEDGVQGRVIVSFDVDVDGKAKNPEIKRSPSPECSFEAIRLVSIMPKWRPGTRNGKPVSVRCTIQLMFLLR